MMVTKEMIEEWHFLVMQAILSAGGYDESPDEIQSKVENMDEATKEQLKDYLKDMLPRTMHSAIMSTAIPVDHVAYNAPMAVGRDVYECFIKD